MVASYPVFYAQEPSQMIWERRVRTWAVHIQASGLNGCSCLLLRWLLFQSSIRMFMERSQKKSCVFPFRHCRIASRCHIYSSASDEKSGCVSV
ncbi:hypothetical protein TorRG33x02_159190 [Trema orientale]|uniref:Uncharacterized protein n=1 Tax=Trema orientale TaxID=63057 RepID=A0A2P5ES35_TREOI|nr:hypothetical protein TorRG33x02_159190 [Trema orientale]